MSFHLHLRSMPSSEVTTDAVALEKLMLAAWDRLPEEYESGVADAIEKIFGHVHTLYTSGAGGSAGPAALPVFGGTQVAGPDPDSPPFVVLDPGMVRATSAFLDAVAFEERWRVAGDELSAPFAGWDDPADAASGTYRAHHEDLRAFYARAARAGHAVVKAFWY